MRGRYNENIEKWTFLTLGVVSLAGAVFTGWVIYENGTALSPKLLLGFVLLLIGMVVGFSRFIDHHRSISARRSSSKRQPLDFMDTPRGIVKPPLHRVRRGR